MRKFKLETLKNCPPYFIKSLIMHLNILISKINCITLKTYLIYDCARCELCGRNVHDFEVPDWLWKEVYGNDRGILCYDCFCDEADRRYHYKWRMRLKEEWNEPIH